jgi:hypothetical protein
VPYIAEYEAGAWHGHHRFTGDLTANHYRLSCLSAIGGGIAGWNWYMLVNRDNWMYSPINERGIPRSDTAPAFKEIVRFFKQMNPPRLDRITNTAVTFELMHHSSRDIWDDDPALDGLYRASIPYEFYDMRSGKIRKPLMIYSGPDWMSDKSRVRLESYVEQGGNLVLFINYPRHNEYYKLKEMFRIPHPDMTLPRKKLRLTLRQTKLELVTEAFAFNKLPGKTITAVNVQTVGEEQGKVSAGEKYLVGCLRKMGKGNVLFLAIQPDSRTLVAVHEFFGISIPCRSLEEETHATLLRRDKRTGFVVVMNMKPCHTVVPIRIDRRLFSTRKPALNDLSTGGPIDSTVRRSELTAYVPVAGKDAAIVKISS